LSGEFDFIDWIRRQSPATPLVSVPPGDDLAVLNWPAGELLLVGADQVLDGVHFDSRVHSPRQIGRKAMNRNLSDCAAMACLPAAAVATVALPRGAGMEYAKELYLGLRDAADAFDCPIVGGDTGSWPGALALSVTILCRSAGIAPITRAGARPGDLVCVTGSLGGSLLGRHMTFEPRIALARRLAGSGHITAMIDLSDGLSRDLRHICRESKVGALIDAEKVPIHPDVLRLADSGSPLEHALHDGEDYELLFTIAPGDVPAESTAIGTVTESLEMFLNSRQEQVSLQPRAWEHTL
jgi:thiamine-monophosphate kinase